MTSALHPPPTATWQQDGGAVILEVSGEWLLDGPGVIVTGTEPQAFPSGYRLESLGAYDSTLPAFLLAQFRVMLAGMEDKEARPTLEELPEQLRGLLKLALAVPEESQTRQVEPRGFGFASLGAFTARAWGGVLALLDFIGLTVLSLGRFFTRRARFRGSDFWVTLQQAGVEALPIVSLISFLVGLILAFVGNVQLSHFGANLFVADLVGIAMVREMGVVMTGIIMSGRTGAAFAAQIGSMKANEEIDALRTFGFNPFDFLVLPRLLALVLMMPLLTVYANAMGILGGMLVGASVGIAPALYWAETLTAVDLTNSSLGVFKSVFFGAAIAVSGCMMGLQAGNSSAAVGEATTRAVVGGITAVVVLDSAFAAIFTVLEI
jgi:phospholipid/cholesterol/gamma-HCH transport system permease protein